MLLTTIFINFFTTVKLASFYEFLAGPTANIAFLPIINKLPSRQCHFFFFCVKIFVYIDLLQIFIIEKIRQNHLITKFLKELLTNQ